MRKWARRPHRDAQPAAPSQLAPGSGSASTSNRCRAWRCSANWDPPACRNRPDQGSGSRCRRRRGRPERAALVTMSMFLLQPPSATCHVMMLRASLSASSLAHHSAGWSPRRANMPRPPDGMFRTGVARGFLLVCEGLLVDGLLFLRPLQILQPHFLLFLRQGRDALAIHGLGDHVHANYFGGGSGGQAQGNKRSQEQKQQGSAIEDGMVWFLSQRNCPCQSEVRPLAGASGSSFLALFGERAERRLRARTKRREWAAGRC